MRNGSGPQLIRLRLVVSFFGVVLLIFAPVTAGVQGARVTVTVTDLRNADGVVRACMTQDQESFPRCRGIPGAYAAKAVASEGTITFTFEGVEPGRYAIALLHDENANGIADRALGMMPKEGFGFSRDAKVRLGPPRFGDAVFDIGRANRDITIRMRYML